MRERFDVDDNHEPHAMRAVLDSLAFVQLGATINDAFRIDEAMLAASCARSSSPSPSSSRAPRMKHRPAKYTESDCC